MSSCNESVQDSRSSLQVIRLVQPEAHVSDLKQLGIQTKKEKSNLRPDAASMAVLVDVIFVRSLYNETQISLMNLNIRYKLCCRLYGELFCNIDYFCMQFMHKQVRSANEKQDN